jgi:DNA-binding LacI/PurR family transcriptional regulator
MVLTRDVANLAGVSITTVSHVATATGQVSVKARDRVLAAVEQTGRRSDYGIVLYATEAARHRQSTSYRYR